MKTFLFDIPEIVSRRTPPLNLQQKMEISSIESSKRHQASSRAREKGVFEN
jgi:hypothetical protein